MGKPNNIDKKLLIMLDLHPDKLHMYQGYNSIILARLSLETKQKMLNEFQDVLEIEPLVTKHIDVVLDTLDLS